MHSSFWYRRLHSLLGVLPVGFFLMEHLHTGYSATQGSKCFIGKVDELWETPCLVLIEICIIALPLLYHALYGMYISFFTDYNPKQMGTFRNWMFTLQRITGMITFVFILWHVWETRMQKMLYDHTSLELTYNMWQILQNEWIVGLYIIGVVAAVFHLSNGLWSFLITWGIISSKRVQRQATWASMAIFLIFSYFGIMAVLAFAQVDFVSGCPLN